MSLSMLNRASEACCTSDYSISRQRWAFRLQIFCLNLDRPGDLTGIPPQYIPLALTV